MMRKKEFLEQLERLLWDIPEQERKEALEFYENYFDDAGEENEATVIQELGSPGKVAATIKADLDENGSEHGEYRETGYTDERFEEKKKQLVMGVDITAGNYNRTVLGSVGSCRIGIDCSACRSSYWCGSSIIFRMYRAVNGRYYFFRRSSYTVSGSAYGMLGCRHRTFDDLYRFIAFAGIFVAGSKSISDLLPLGN